MFAKDLSVKVLSYLSAGLQSEGGLAPERLGELLVAVESKCGDHPLAGDAIRRILRGALVVHDYSSPSGGDAEDINVIVRICQPFMFQSLDTPELEKARARLLSEFRKVADKFEQLAEEIPQKEWVRSTRMKNLMDPVMAPVIGLICGEGNSVDSSALPQAVKKVLLAIDKQVILWFGNKGTGKPADLLEARKNAVIGFLSTRSLGYVWLTKSKQEKGINESHLTRLMSYMNSCVSSQIDEFVMDLLLTQPDQPVEARKYIEVLTKKSALKSKPSVPKLALATGAGAKMLSPRAPGAPGTPRTATVSTTSKKAEEKKAKAELMQMRVARAKHVDKLAEDSGLMGIDYGFYQHVKGIVVNMSRRGYDHFCQNPTESLMKHADKYYAMIQNHQQVKNGVPEKVRNALRALALHSIGNPFEDAEGDAGTTASPPVAARAAPAPKESSETESSDETEVETESSEDEKRG